MMYTSIHPSLPCVPPTTVLVFHTGHIYIRYSHSVHSCNCTYLPGIYVDYSGTRHSAASQAHYDYCSRRQSSRPTEHGGLEKVRDRQHAVPAAVCLRGETDASIFDYDCTTEGDNDRQNAVAATAISQRLNLVRAERDSNNRPRNRDPKGVRLLVEKG